MSDESVDLLVVGGGVTGAAVLHAAAQAGLRALLVEREDFASGTSSWSSKLVHGGLRYLKGGHWRMTLQSVREREALLRDWPGLVQPQPFLMPLRAGQRPSALALRAAFALADAMALRRTARHLGAAQAAQAEPVLDASALQGAVAYREGVVDDARLVLRLIQAAQALGATALNRVEAHLLEEGGRTVGAELRDAEDGRQRTLRARVTVLATGVWVAGAPGAPRLRPLRGSHLVFPAVALPLRCGVAWMHPDDGRPVFAHPWEGAAVVGTTDVDHPDVQAPAVATAAEVAYLVRALAAQFPRLDLRAAQALAGFSGLRAIMADDPGTAPSDMARDSALWSRPGLVGISGGKLTTHRASAREVLAAAVRQGLTVKTSAQTPAAPPGSRLEARLGRVGAAWVAGRPAAERQPLLGTPYVWAELLWSLREEQVRHLDDLLLRRTRLGLVAAQGAQALLPRLQGPCIELLGWSAQRWQAEADRYRAHWLRHHSPVLAEAAA